MSTKYAAKSARQSVEDSVRSYEKILADPIAARAIQRKDRMRRAYQREKEALERLTPPEVKGDGERKKISDRCKELEGAMIAGDSGLGIDPMPTRREMWESPAGSIGRETRWQKFWKNHTIDEKRRVVKSKEGYGGVFEWKDNRRRLLKEREEDDADVSNIETFRPDTIANDTLAEYRNRAYASPLASMSYEEIDKLFPDREPSDVEKKLRDSEHLMAREAVAVSPVKPHLSDTWTQCSFVDPATTRQCRFRGKRESGRCSHHEGS